MAQPCHTGSQLGWRQSDGDFRASTSYAAAMIVTRFAPSPTGRLHAGNIRTALVNWLLARSAGGRFVLRLDDTDLARSTAESAQSIRDDLAWLGLAPDMEVKQSDRFDRYEDALARLAAQGRAYPCYESAEELELKRRVALSRGLPPIYDRAALALTDADKANLEAEGRKPHWRFRMDETADVEWQDGVRGHCHFPAAALADLEPLTKDGSDGSANNSSSNVRLGQRRRTQNMLYNYNVDIFLEIDQALCQLNNENCIRNGIGIKTLNYSMFIVIEFCGYSLVSLH